MRFRLASSLVALLLAGLAHAEPVTLTFTVPSTQQLRYGEGDSEYVYCEGGIPTRDLAWVRVWRLPISGGAWRCVDSIYVRGMEGQQASITVEPGPGAHFSTQAVDTVGNPSCWGNVFYAGPITGVGTEPRHDGALTVQYFDVQGRLVRDQRASGIYFWYGKDKRGHIIRRGKIAVVR